MAAPKAHAEGMTETTPTPMTLEQVQAALAKMTIPGFVGEIFAVAHRSSFNTFPGVDRDYTIQVRIGGPGEHPDVYTEGGRKTAITNNPFMFPANEDELRVQVIAAILMGVAHETIEQVTDGGRHLMAPHRFKGGSTLDTAQWLFMLDSLVQTVANYSAVLTAGEP